MSHPSKFFSLIQTLTPTEHQGFQKFLHRYHGGETVALKVFSKCKQFYAPRAAVEKIEVAEIYRKVFKAEMGPEVNDRKKVLNPLSDLSIWLKEFLLSEKMHSESWVAKMVWLGVLHERGLHREFSSLASELFEAQGQKPLPDAVACLQQIATGLYYKRHLVQHQATPDFQALIDCTETIKLGADIISLKAACEILNDQQVRSKEGPKESDPVSQPLFTIYQMIFSLLNTNREAEYPGIVTFLNDHLELLSETEVFTITKMLHNFAAPRIRGIKNIEWAKQVHGLDLILLKKGLYTQQGVMSPTSFCNIVNAACIAKELDWAQNFIAVNGTALPENARNESIDLSNAILAFEEKKFKEVLNLVEKSQVKHIQHMARSKALKLRALFEINPDDEAIEALYISFEKYLKHHRKEQPELAAATLSFVGLFKELHQERLDKQALIQRIETTTPLYFRQWLLEKAQDYKGRNVRQKPKGK